MGAKKKPIAVEKRAALGLSDCWNGAMTEVVDLAEPAARGKGLFA
jgi:hypothetical protein